jgi:4-diphosphocytidyl-2-C-methyl-D-erythritol kinase
VRRFAAAKINLYLHVLGRRDDGYHELDSLVVFADVGDELIFTPAAALTIEVEGPFAAGVPVDARNLVLKAAVALQTEAGVAAGARIRLVKALPVASGLGGGSSDAAQALLGLSSLWGLKDAGDRVATLAARLGADVPVCLGARPAYFGGIGERLDPAPALPDLCLVLANAGLPVSTPAVFRTRTGPFSAPGRLTESIGDAADLARALLARRNDLEAAAEQVEPQIARVRGALADAKGCLLARVSGSGGTCFGLFGTAAAATAAAAGIAGKHPTWWVRPARLQGAGKASRGEAV